MKFKEKQVEHFLYVNAKLSKELMVNEREIAAFSEKPIRSFFRVEWKKKDALEFSGPVSVSLFNRLQQPIGKLDFFVIVEQIVDSTIKMQEKGFMWNKVLWDINRVYFNEMTKEIKLLYFPLTTGLPENGNAMTLLWSILQLTKPYDEKDPYFAVNFYNFLKTQSAYNPYVIENYIQQTEKKAVNITKGHKEFSGYIGNPLDNAEKPQINRYVEPVPFNNTAANLRDAASVIVGDDEDLPTGVLEENTNGAYVLPTGVAEPVAYAQPAPAPVPEPAPMPVPAPVPNPTSFSNYSGEGQSLPENNAVAGSDAAAAPVEEPTPVAPVFEPVSEPPVYEAPAPTFEQDYTAVSAPLPDATTAASFPAISEEDYSQETALLVQEEDPNETALLVEEDAPEIVYPKLIRLSTGEEVQINKPVFRIGKEKSYVDYFVNNNNAVSRSHADIVSRGSHYYVVDLNSKNRTFINGHVVPVRCETEIYNGDRLKLANEEFTFTV